MANQTKVRDTDKLTCIGCDQTLPRGSFGPATPCKDGTERWKSRCRKCANKQARSRIERQSMDKLLFEEAPKRAVARLLEMYPQIRASLAKKYRFDYIQLLKDERGKLVKTRKQYLEKVSRHRHK